MSLSLCIRLSFFLLPLTDIFFIILHPLFPLLHFKLPYSKGSRITQRMAMQYFEQTVTQNDFNGEDDSCLEKWKSAPSAVTSFDDDIGRGFDCNICLDSVQDPVVTLCGHLYCWPCIYKWLQYDTNSTESGGQQQQQCPVCKAEVSQTTLVPLYGRGQTTTKTSKGKTPHLGIVIPRRPRAPACTVDALVSPISTTSPHPTTLQQSQPNYNPNMLEPVIGMFGEMVYARAFGNSITNIYTYPNSYHYVGINSPRVRRHVMQADRSLNRICLFLFYCICLCLLLF